MAKQRLKSPRARLFVALDLPDPVRGLLEGWQAAECADPALRPVASPALHLTLCFLGYHPERAIGRIGEIAAGIERRAVELRFERDPVPLPPRRPRLFAVGATSEAAIELQAELSAALEAEHLQRPEKRAFWPHITVARVRPERARGPAAGRRRGRPRRVEAPPGPLPERLLDPFGAVRMTVYRSILKPQGAEYLSLDAVDLPPPRATEEVNETDGS